MISEIYGEISKSLKFMKRNKIISILAFFPPLVITIFFIQAFTFTGSSYWTLAVVNQDIPITQTNWSGKFIESLGSDKGTIPYFNVEVQDENSALKKFEQREVWAVLYIPEGFNEHLNSGNTSIEIVVKMNNLHEDVSKNIRLGIEGRIYLFSSTYELKDGLHPGFTIENSLSYEKELARSDYMISGMLILAMVWFGFFIGGTLGTIEKDLGTLSELKMASNGIANSHIGKIFATVIISFILLWILVGSLFIFRNGMPINFVSIVTLILLFFVLNTIFSILGVSYGLKVGDFRAIPGPSILLALTLWILSGGINPIQFGSGSDFFSYLPSTAANQILLVGLYSRGSSYLLEASSTLVVWLIIAVVIFLVIQKKYRSETIK